MKKIVYLIAKITIYTVLVIFVGMGAFTAALQTHWGRTKFLTALEDVLKKNDVQITFTKFEGLLPFIWEFQNLQVILPNQTTISAEFLRFRPYLSRIVKKEFALHSLIAKKMSYSTKEAFTSEFLQKEVDLPLSIYVKYFKITDLQTTIQKQNLTIDILGKAKIDRKGNKLFIKTLTTRKEFPKSSLKLTVRARKDQKIKAILDINTPTNLFFKPLLEVPFESASAFRAHLLGSFEAFESLLFHPTKAPQSIYGKLLGTVVPLQKSTYPFLDTLSNEVFDVSSDIRLFSNHSLELSKIDISNKLIDVQGSLKTNSDFSLEEFDFYTKTEDLTPFSKTTLMSGNLSAHISGKKEAEGININTDFEVNSLQIKKNFIEKIQGNVTSFYKNHKLTGTLNFSMLLYHQNWMATSSFEWEKSLYFRGFHVFSSFADFYADAEITNDGFITASTHFRSDDLSLFEVIIPEISAYGSLEGTSSFSKQMQNGKPIQNVDLHIDFFDLFYSTVHINSLSLNAFFTDLYQDPQGNISTEMENVLYKGIQIANISFTTNTESENWPFKMAAKGMWRDPFEVHTNGFWKLHSSDLLVNLQDFTGHMFTHSFSLSEPTQIEYRPSYYFFVDHFHLNLAGAFLDFHATLTKDQSELQLKTHHLPVDFLSLNSLELSVEGFATMDLNLEQKDKEANGHFDLEIDSFHSLSIAEDPLSLHGTLHADFDEGYMDLKSQLLLHSDKKLIASANIPMVIDLMPFSVSFNDSKKAEGSFFYNARAEDILDFINIGPYRFESDVYCDLKFEGTLSHLDVIGSCDVTNGTFDNYYTGTFFEEIQGKFRATEGRLILESFSGEDEEKGHFSGSGHIDFDPKKSFPYEAEVHFKDLIVMDIPLVDATTEGTLQFSGNAKEGHAKGTIHVTEADFSIPETIPTPIPTLDPTFINGPNRTTIQKHKKPYPLDLNIKVLAEKNVFISGRGLSSEWQGNFQIAGTYNDIIAKGNLSLLKGDFLFAGKYFDLIKGSLIFPGKSNEPPLLDIAGQIEQSGVSIVVGLKGKLNAPKLTFRSTPSLPVSEILAYLIFGSDVSEISAFQAAQLAATAASLSGKGPDIFEITRKTLGIDRFAVVHTPSAGEDQMGGSALQIGKYLMRGLLVSISHGSDPISGNISVEVDLTKGFIFQAETIQQQQQGKFILKWHYNY